MTFEDSYSTHLIALAVDVGAADMLWVLHHLE